MVTYCEEVISIGEISDSHVRKKVKSGLMEFGFKIKSLFRTVCRNFFGLVSFFIVMKKILKVNSTFSAAKVKLPGIVIISIMIMRMFACEE